MYIACVQLDAQKTILRENRLYWRVAVFSVALRGCYVKGIMVARLRAVKRQIIKAARVCV